MSDASAVVEVITAVGGLGGLGAALSAVAALMEARRVRASIPAAATRTEEAIDALRSDGRAIDRRIGHELGEIRRASDREHADYDARIRELEHRQAMASTTSRTSSSGTST